MRDFDSNEHVIARDFVVAGKFMKGMPTLEDKSKSLGSSDHLLTVFFSYFLIVVADINHILPS